MSLDFTVDQSTLVQVMAWCRQATSHYPSQCRPNGNLTQPNISIGRSIVITWTSFTSLVLHGLKGFTTHSLVVLLPSKKRRHFKIDIIMDPSVIYSHVTGLLVSQHDFDLQRVLSMELTAYPPYLLLADGSMRHVEDDDNECCTHENWKNIGTYLVRWQLVRYVNAPMFPMFSAWWYSMMWIYIYICCYRHLWLTVILRHGRYELLPKVRYIW